MNKVYIINKNNKAIVRIFKYTYAKSLQYVKELVEIAKNDFPKLQDEDIHVVVLSGDRHNKTTAIQFVVEVDVVPKEYFKLTRNDELGFCNTYN